MYNGHLVHLCNVI